MSIMRGPIQRRLHISESIDESVSLNETYHLNFARIFSQINRKHFPQVDEQGNALNYIVAVKQASPDHTGNSQVVTAITTANQGYVTKAAVKAWHRARNKMLRREGITKKQLGPYSRSLRFPMTASDTTITGGGAPGTAGEWTYTKFAVESPQDTEDTSGDVTSANLVDDYSLTLTGASVKESAEEGETKYTTVGIIESWLQSRRQKSDFVQTDSTEMDHETNPLYNILSGTMASEEVLEIVEDHQKELAPYSTQDSAWTDKFDAGRLTSAVNIVDQTIITAPCGLAQFTVTSQNSDSDTATDSTVSWEFELLDVVPM